MLDIVIRGDRVVTPWGVGSYDIGIQGEKIVAVQSPNTLTGDVQRVIDATGKIVIPGGIEPHAHVAWATFTTKQQTPADLDSLAAAFGGTTTICDFAKQYPDMDIFQAIEERNSQWQGKAYTDYAYHCWLFGPPSATVLSQIGEVIKAGFPSIKVFTTNLSPSAEQAMYRKMSMGQISAVMEQVAAYGGITFIHGEDDDIVFYMYGRLKEENRTEWYNIHLAHNNLSEDLAFWRVIRVAERMGAAVHFAHVSARESVQHIQQARNQGLPIYGESLHNYVTFTADYYK
jgi:dihydropyrimidinase